jgi:hypothetical protein
VFNLRRSIERLGFGYMPDPIRPFLASLDRDALVDLIPEEADRDDGLAERLGLRAAMAAPGTDGLPALKKAIGRATRAYGFLRSAQLAPRRSMLRGPGLKPRSAPTLGWGS